jgi:hypothetical protein
MRENGLFVAPPQGCRLTPPCRRPLVLQHELRRLGPNGGEIAAARDHITGNHIFG